MDQTAIRGNTWGPSEAQKDVCHKTSFHSCSWRQATQPSGVCAPSQIPDTPFTTQPLTSSHPQPAAPTASGFHYSAFELPSVILQQLLRQHEQGARLRFCLFNIQPGEYHLRQKAWMKRTFLSLLFHRPSSVLLKGHSCISSWKFSVYKNGTCPLNYLL